MLTFAFGLGNTAKLLVLNSSYYFEYKVIITDDELPKFRKTQFVINQDYLLKHNPHSKVIIYLQIELKHVIDHCCNAGSKC